MCWWSYWADWAGRQSTTTLHASLFPPYPIFQPPLATISHLGPGSIHPDGGFIFVFVYLLIHASSYSGHRRGFRSTTECKSPRRLIHFHLSLVNIQLLPTFPTARTSLSFRVWDQACSDQAGRASTLVSLLCAFETQYISHLPPTFAVFKTFCPLHIFPPLPRLTLAPHRGSHQEKSRSYSAISPWNGRLWEHQLLS